MTATTIHAHPSLTLPPGWRWGALADVPGYTAWHALHESGASALVVERPDYDCEAEDQEAFEDALRAQERHPDSLTALKQCGRWCVRDLAGGVWWPSESAEAEIERAQDPGQRAVEICASAPTRGTWRS